MPSSFASLQPLNIVVPSGYGYVGLAATGGLWLSLFQGFWLVNRARKAAKIPYPQAYAEKAEAATNKAAHKFNCVQRAHHNLLETLPTYLFSILFAGLKHPREAAALGAVWVVGRTAYALGYGTGDPQGRVKGAIPSGLALMALLGTATYTAIEFIQEAGGF